LFLYSLLERPSADAKNANTGLTAEGARCNGGEEYMVLGGVKIAHVSHHNLAGTDGEFLAHGLAIQGRSGGEGCKIDAAVDYAGAR
jgi:hypothetical protein